MEDIKLNVDTWTFTAVERSRGRMKLQIKLSKEQTEAFKNFSETLKPAEATDAEWLQMIFFTGCERINERVYEMAQDYAEHQAEQLEASGLTIIEDEEGLTLTEKDAPESPESASAL